MRALDVRTVTIAWVLSRGATFLAAVVGSWAAVSAGGVDYLDLWNQWDTRWFESIATEGYVGSYVSDFEDFRYNVAFFPGLPMLMRLGLTVGISPILMGLLVSFVAGLVAALALVRLLEQVGGRGSWAAVAWVVAPTAVFLSAAYTEALFAAFAFWSWVMARQGAWLASGLLATAAALVRPNALFLVAGLWVLFVVSKPRSVRDWSRGWPLLLPLVSVAGFFTYLRSVTGSWTAWSDAQRDFWDREFVDPLTSLRNTYELIFTFSPTGEPSSRMLTEIIAMAIMLGVVILAMRKRWWAESVYVGATALSLGTSSMYYSIPRTLILIFPLWVLVGLWLSDRRWLQWLYVVLAVPALVLVTILFTQGQWIS